LLPKDFGILSQFCHAVCPRANEDNIWLRCLQVLNFLNSDFVAAQPASTGLALFHRAVRKDDYITDVLLAINHNKAKVEAGYLSHISPIWL
jgi:hypothetical protein